MNPDQNSTTDVLFQHIHPYGPFLDRNTEKLIVGTLPPPRFSTGDLKPGDVDFCYGSRDGQLWPILDRIFDLGLRFEGTREAVDQRMHFLRARKIGICDIVASARRQKVDASDLGMEGIVLRDLVGLLNDHPAIHTLLFMGGNSKNGPEYLFRRQLKEHKIVMEVVSGKIPRIHQVDISKTRSVKTVSLTAPSGAANRAVGSLPEYKLRKQNNAAYTTLDFRVDQYKAFF